LLRSYRSISGLSFQLSTQPMMRLPGIVTLTRWELASG
jgi:hypothetical protein